MNNNRLITMAAIVSFGTITAANLSHATPQDTGNLPTSRQWIGLAIVFLMLSAASDLGVESAGGMAVLVMVTVLLARGESAATYLGVTLNFGKPRMSKSTKNLGNAIQKAQRMQFGKGKPNKLQSNTRKPQKPANAATTQA